MRVKNTVMAASIALSMVLLSGCAGDYVTGYSVSSYDYYDYGYDYGYGYYGPVYYSRPSVIYQTRIHSVPSYSLQHHNRPVYSGGHRSDNRPHGAERHQSRLENRHNRSDDRQHRAR